MELKFPQLPESFDGYKIIHITDFHSKVYGINNDVLIKSIERENPDIVVMTGDMVSNQEEDFNIFYELCDRIVKNYPVYYVTGNHEQDFDREILLGFLNDLKSRDVNVLDNEKVILKKGEGKIYLHGLWYPMDYYKGYRNLFNKEILELEKAHIDEYLGKASKDHINILLTHNPFHFDEYIEWGGDLILVGHVHGGMIRLPIIGGLLSSEVGLFPKYDKGIISKGNQKMLVNTGIGVGEIGFRLFNTPEIVTITLRKRWI